MLCMGRLIGGVALLTVFVIAAGSGVDVAAAADYRIENVKGNVYRVVNDRHRSVFAVTEAGIIATDPMDEAAARWLKGELEERFSQPVRYVIYSHNHSDHVYGGRVFEAPGVEFVSHRLAKQDLEWTRADTALPGVTFEEEMRIELGGTTVELRYHGPNDGRGSISMLFRPANVIFVVDWIVIGRMPWQKLWSYDIHGMINSTREVLELDFDRLVGGHAEVGDKDDVREYLGYLEALYGAVVDAVHRGDSLETMKEEIGLERYSHFRNYEEWLPLNIEGVHERLMEESGMGWRPDLP